MPIGIVFLLGMIFLSTIAFIVVMASIATASRSDNEAMDDPSPKPPVISEME